MTRRRLASGEVYDVVELEAHARVRPAPQAPSPRPVLPPKAPLTVKLLPASLKTDLGLLEALAATQGKLSAAEREAFTGMLNRLRAGWIRALSYAQRAWAQEVGARVGLDIEHPGDWRETAAQIQEPDLRNVCGPPRKK